MARVEEELPHDAEYEKKEECGDFRHDIPPGLVEDTILSLLSWRHR